MLRNILVFCCNVDLSDRKVHTSTVTYTLCKTVELNRNTDSDRLLVVNLIEVNVEQSVCYWVELQLLQDCSVLLAVKNKLDNVDMRSVNNLSQLAHWASDRHCQWCAVLVLSLSIDIARDKSFLTHCLSGFLTDVSSFLTFNFNFFHNCVTLN